MPVGASEQSLVCRAGGWRRVVLPSLRRRQRTAASIGRRELAGAPPVASCHNSITPGTNAQEQGNTVLSYEEDSI